MRAFLCFFALYREGQSVGCADAGSATPLAQRVALRFATLSGNLHFRPFLPFRKAAFPPFFVNSSAFAVNHSR
jgi:hypothetical protein